MNERWCGGQHHFIATCNFHLATFVNGYLISTVGEYYPQSRPDKMETLGYPPDSFYETMVFPLMKGQTIEPFAGECPEVQDWGGLETDRYSTHQEAMRGHLEYVDRARNGELP